MNERRSQTDFLERSRGIVQSRKQKVDSLFPNFVRWLRDHRQSRLKRVGPFEVIESDKSYISRYLKATLSQRD
jgi:hypothetical protein